MDEDSVPSKREDYRYMQEKPKTDKMGILRELEFRPKLQKLQHEPTVTPSMSIVWPKPRQFVDPHDYHIMKQGKVQDAHDNDRYICKYSTIEQQIRAYAMLSRQIFQRRAKRVWKANKTGGK